jgi:glycine oxidase
VIGAGVIGLAVADELARRGVDVTILEMRAPGMGASQASAGILAPYVEAEAGSPLLELGVRSLALYDDFVAGLTSRTGRAIEYARTGTLQVAVDEAHAHTLSDERQALEMLGVDVEWIDAAGVRTAEPSVTDRALGALRIGVHGLVGVRSLVAALMHSARFAGAQLVTPIEGVDLSLRGDGVEVRTVDRAYQADRAVLAAGSWSSRIRSPLPALPVRPVRGELLHLTWRSASTTIPRAVVWGPACYCVPWRDGTLLVGATSEDAGFDERATVEGVRDLSRAVVDLLPAASRAALEGVRVGLRPALPDGLPAIGPFRGGPQVVAATGHFRNGILLAPITARIVASWLIDGAADASASATSPDRFAMTS